MKGKGRVRNGTGCSPRARWCRRRGAARSSTAARGRRRCVGGGDGIERRRRCRASRLDSFGGGVPGEAAEPVVAVDLLGELSHGGDEHSELAWCVGHGEGNRGRGAGENSGEERAWTRGCSPAGGGREGPARRGASAARRRAGPARPCPVATGKRMILLQRGPWNFQVQHRLVLASFSFISSRF